jgi:hypothetical protein
MESAEILVMFNLGMHAITGQFQKRNLKDAKMGEYFMIMK